MIENFTMVVVTSTMDATLSAYFTTLDPAVDDEGNTLFG